MIGNTTADYDDDTCECGHPRTSHVAGCTWMHCNCGKYLR